MCRSKKKTDHMHVIVRTQSTIHIRTHADISTGPKGIKVGEKKKEEERQSNMDFQKLFLCSSSRERKLKRRGGRRETRSIDTGQADNKQMTTKKEDWG